MVKVHSFSRWILAILAGFLAVLYGFLGFAYISLSRGKKSDVGFSVVDCIAQFATLISCHVYASLVPV